ncbi:acyl-CoA N-acyltransferase [Plenodomus tracheiphilus IPT5]|uniref:Acyl-CoA N-acyltransferase n=1 Tax=Plenodomus tracheiphilus IPT5 TaxID=1408161 RepID=A0A6A7B2I2_9PLEO|nr:acyl-CoA N-acyltransferase [Plenodomus tracheiphilus IPT5]
MSQSSSPQLTIRPATFPPDKETVARLFLAYAQTLPISLAFQDFDAELAGLPGKYAAEVRGTVFLAGMAASQPTIGCIAIRPFYHTKSATPSTQTKVCELKCLYLTPSSRGRGVAKMLLSAAVQRARELGYEEMLFHTIASMTAARRLYEGYGFEEIERYYERIEGAVFYRLGKRKSRLISFGV